MLQINYIRSNKEEIIEGLRKRSFNANPIIEEVLSFDEERRKVQSRLDEILAKSNLISKEIGLLYKQGEIEEANQRKKKTAEFKKEANQLKEQLRKVSSILNELLYEIPNVPNAIVPKGNSEADNEIIFKAAELPDLGKHTLPHWELAKKYDLIDFELGNKIAGAGFPVYKGKGAKLQRALISYFLDKNTSAGYTEYQLPLLVNEKSGYGTGQLPDKEGQMYCVKEDNLYLIPTAEVPGTNIYRDALLNESELPIALTGYTPCFRREAGSYGSHVRGLNRLHQFDKVEIIRIEHPDNSYQALEKMITHVKGILDELELPYRILRLCGGDLGFTSALTYDFEVYSAAQKKWLEISSVSNFETYQANRLKLRIKSTNGKKYLAHTLNGSSLALPRVMAGLLENFQTSSGIVIPKVLVPYTGFNRIGLSD